MEGEGVGGDKKQIIRAFGAIDIIYEPRMVTLEWIASPCNDMFADAVLSAVLQAESLDSPKYLPPSNKLDKNHFKECLIELLQDMFGEESVPKIFSGDTITVSVDNKAATVNLTSLTVSIMMTWMIFMQMISRLSARKTKLSSRSCRQLSASCTRAWSPCSSTNRWWSLALYQHLVWIERF